jgi:hypothetical protein
VVIPTKSDESRVSRGTNVRERRATCLPGVTFFGFVQGSFMLDQPEIGNGDTKIISPEPAAERQNSIHRLQFFNYLVTFNLSLLFILA